MTPLEFPRNEGVPGSNPGVGFLRPVTGTPARKAVARKWLELPPSVARTTRSECGPTVNSALTNYEPMGTGYTASQTASV